ncbi:hypothetical protein AQJ58_03020 [Streptomyces sp. DSM 15324]|nr:hypothetical protein AQJ58_03020 [Streptomyces sp. DSM 15324]
MDKGPGMTEEQRRRAFERFWRAPGAPKGGTGQGLALVQRLAHASGGEAVLRWAPLGGLDAVVRLPVAPDRAGGGPGVPSQGLRRPLQTAAPGRAALTAYGRTDGDPGRR